MSNLETGSGLLPECFSIPDDPQFKILVSNLDMGVSQEHLDSILGATLAGYHVITNFTDAGNLMLSLADAEKRVRWLMCTLSWPFRKFELDPKSEDQRQWATVTYWNPQVAMRAAFNLDGYQEQRFGALEIVRVTTVEFQILGRLVRMMDSIVDLANQYVNRPIVQGVQVTRSSSTTLSEKLTLRGEGNGSLPYLASIKTAIGRVLEGVIVVDDEGYILWCDQFISSPDWAAQHIANAVGNEVYIDVDGWNRYVRMYLGSEAEKEQVRTELVRISKLHPTQRIIALLPDLPGSDEEDAFKDLLLAAGLDLEGFEDRESEYDHYILEFPGTKELENQIEALAQATSLTDNVRSPRERICPVCTFDVIIGDGSFTQECRHVYHKTCLVEYAFEVLATGSSMPLGCCGTSPSWNGKCDQDMHMTPELLKELLTQQELEEALKFSKYYVRTNSDIVRFCPHPDCSGVYRPTTQSSIHICTVCLEPICTSCHVPYHRRQNCAQYQAGLQPYESPDVKKCPRCKTQIANERGSAKIQCWACKRWSCWLCNGGIEAGPHEDGSDVEPSLLSPHVEWCQKKQNRRQAGYKEEDRGTGEDAENVEEAEVDTDLAE
jgi:hypothetical protein